MTESGYREPVRQCCDICDVDKIIIRRVTRTTQVCPHSTDRLHRNVRASRRESARIAEIERHIARHQP